MHWSGPSEALGGLSRASEIVELIVRVIKVDQSENPMNASALLCSTELDTILRSTYSAVAIAAMQQV